MTSKARATPAMITADFESRLAVPAHSPASTARRCVS
nr:MAG TPA: hypothetical protein [Caudoviricetes sp.]